MIIHWSRCLVTLFCVSFAAVGASAEATWKLPNLLPFSSKDAQPTRKAAGRGSLGASLIRPVSHLVPDLTPIPKVRPGGTSTLSKLAAGTKQLHRQTTRTLSTGAKKVRRDTKALVVKSQQLLVPWSQPATTTSRRRSSRGSSSRGPNGGGDVLGLPNWWSSGYQPPRKPVLTPTDWLGQDRVGD